jgi:DNA-binding MarR family transcriptional regulator
MAVMARVIEVEPGPDLATGLIRLARLVNSLFSTASAAHDLTASQARMLCILAERPRGMGELAGLLGIDKAGVTGLVDRVERRGLAERTAVPGDRRALRVQLTEAGQRAAVAVHELICAELDALTAGLAPADRERFRSTVALIAGERLLSAQRCAEVKGQGWIPPIVHSLPAESTLTVTG